MKINLLFCLLTIVLYSCTSDEFSPNQKSNSQSPTEVNATEIATLPKKAAGAHIKIAVSGDTQREYGASRDFVNYVNSRDDIDFVILNGDVSDFGLLLEFQGVYKIYKELKVPFITIIGNHDQVANGFEIYKLMFGATNFTFDYAGIKFVAHDSNSREHNFDGTTPDLNWLKQNLDFDNGTNHIIALSHVPPTDGDFDQALRNDYETLFNNTPGMLASIHSHQHTPDVIYRKDGSGIPFIITNAIVNRAFTIIDITNGDLTAQAINF